MSKRRNKKERVKAARAAKASPVTNADPAPKIAQPKVAKPRPSQSRPVASGDRALTFGADTYKWMGIGFALVLVGLLLMAGARGDEFNEFDEDFIYGFRRITLAPIVILAGIGTVAFAILKK